MKTANTIALFATTSIALFVTAVFGADALKGTNDVVRWEGRVSRAGTNLVFKTKAGEYTIQRNSTSEALFVDTNLLSRTLLLTGRPREKGFEVIGNLRSIKNGKVHELFYYCDICSITTSSPGLCQCCREPSEFREEPAN